MKHKDILMVLMLLSIPAIAAAQLFEVGGISYQVLSPSEHTVEVIPRLSCTYYSGNINIPSTVSHNDTIYVVVALGEEAFCYARLSSITIPSTVTQIKYGCFLFASVPSSITIPASVTYIGPLAFAANNLTNITVDANNTSYMSMDGMLFSKDTTTVVECMLTKSGTVSLPQDTKHISPLAFAYCHNIVGITLPEGLSSIGSWAFVDNQRLNHVVIPSSVTHLGACPFPNCPALSSLSIAEGNTHYYMDGMMIYSVGGDTLVSAHRSADSVYLPSTLRYVTGFGGNSTVRYVHIPDGVNTIGNEAFNGSSLVSIDLPARLASIDDWAFYNCTSLARIAMPVALDTMGEGVFHSCSQLTSITIPNRLRTIPEAAFFMCTSLSRITWGDSVEVIDTAAFGDCAFPELVLPATLRSIRQTAFIGDYNGRLKRVIFSAPVDTIEMDAFYMQPLSLLRLKNLQPPVTTADGCLDNTFVDTISIPCGSLNAYLADPYWGQFADVYREDCSQIDSATNHMITVYPNPATTRLTIGVNSGNCRVELVNALGQSVLSQCVDGGTANIDVAGIARGIYFLILRTTARPAMRKVVLQ